MPERGALVAALAGDAPVPPAAAPLYLSLYLEPRRRKLLAGVYAEMARGAASLRLTFDEELEAQLEALSRSMDLFADPPAWLPIGLGPPRSEVDGAEVTFPTGQCLWHPPTGAEPIDYLALFDNRHGDLWEIGEALPDPVDIRSAPPGPAWEDLVELGMAELPRRAVQRFGDRFVLYAGMGTPFWHCYARLGFAGMMRALREHPEVIDACVAKAPDSVLAHAQALWHAGVRCIFVEECLSSADLISVADYLRFAYAATRDLLAALRDIGFSVVYYYCGALTGRLEHLAALPCHALAFEESKKGFVIDLAQIRREIGPDRLLFGNTEAVLVRDGSEEQIAAHVAAQWREVGPRYVVSIGSPATLDTSPAKLDMLVRAAQKLGP